MIEREWRQEGKRWALVKNKSNRLETIPESSLPIDNVEVVYKLKTI